MEKGLERHFGIKTFLDQNKTVFVVNNTTVDKEQFVLNFKNYIMDVIQYVSEENDYPLDIFYQENSEWKAIESSQESRAWYGKLPESQSGRYKIEIGGTRGNASYELFVGVSAVDH